MTLYILIPIGLLVGVVWGLILSPSSKHRRYIKRAYRVLDKIDQIPNDAQALAYLKKIHHFVFEEAILNAVERHRKDVRIIRNKRYTGDGGLDGRLVLPGDRLVYIQAKRYGDYVNAADVKALGQLVRRDGAAFGLFVHTGKTGDLSWQHAQSGRVVIVSGSKLVHLMRSGEFRELRGGR